MKNLTILFAIIALASCKKDECPKPDEGEKRNITFVFTCDGAHESKLFFDQETYKITADSGTYTIVVEYIERKPEAPTHYLQAISKVLHDKPINLKWYYPGRDGEVSYGDGFAGTKQIPIQSLYLD
jgi:hypothetical protein